MNPETNNQDETVKQDEDVRFELEKEPALAPINAMTSRDKAVGETIIPAKEDTLGNSDFPPLTESDKQPKLPDPQ